LFFLLHLTILAARKLTRAKAQYIIYFFASVWYHWRKSFTWTPFNIYIFKKFSISIQRGSYQEGYDWHHRWCNLRNFFFSVGNQIFLFYNFNTTTHGGLKNIIFEFFFDRVPPPPAFNGSKKHQKTPFGPYLQFLVLQFR
jgi:hypothetical protein